MTSPHIGIIGGGIAGSTAALHFSQLGYQVTIFERGTSLVDGPPICHLHAGGNLYREISQDQCVQLLKESIETVKLYQHTLNVRPTVIAVPTQDKGQPEELLPRLQVIRQTYQDLVDEDASNQVLGEPSHYFKLYSKAELEALALLNEPDPSSLTEKSLDEWMIPFARNVDLNTLKFPVVLVQEYGLSVFRLSASVKLALAQRTQCQVHTQTQVVGVSKREASSTQTAGWVIQHQPYRVAQSQDSSQPIKTAQASTEQISRVKTTAVQTTTVDYLINASGYQTGVVDDWIEAPRSRLVEFKAAYVTNWQQGSALWPEVIFHGERGTPQGMAQLTPYPDGYFQLHGMTEDITLFEDGVATSTEQSSQPKLPEHLVNKIIHGWSEEQQNDRTNKAIKHMAQFIPTFASATIGGKPLFGAQQIPGSDITLRAASVSFAGDNYARMEIVKASSALEAAKQIEKHIRELGWQIEQQSEASNTLDQLDSEQVLQVACELAEQRQYPVALAKVGGVKPAVK